MLEFLRRLQYLINRRRLDRELAAEMDAHREIAAHQGRPFGNALRLREEARDAWGWTWIDRLLQDLRYAARMLRKSPGFTLAAILMLAIGIGVNVAAFGFFNLILFKPLPVRDPATLVRFQRQSPQGYASYVPYPEMTFLRQYSKTLSSVLASTGARLRIEGEEKPLSAHFVTANFFRDLGASPIRGRLIDSSIDASPNATPVVVLSHSFWQRHFAADPSVVGKIIRLSAKPVTVIGIASDTFSGLDLSSSDVWLPLTQQPYFVNGSRLLTDFSDNDGVDMWGRLQPGLAPKVAEDELKSLLVHLYNEHPTDLWKNESLHSDPAGYARVAHGRNKGSGVPQSPWRELYPVIALVSALVLLILAVSCGNLGSLLLARGVAREREMAIRISVGAGAPRLIRQLFTESLLLAFLGSLAGLALGFVTLRTFIFWLDAPSWLNPNPDWRVAIFSIAMAVLAAILFGLTPALQAVRRRHGVTILRQFLIVAQIAASCVLLVVSSLLVRALNHALHFNPGFEYQNVALIEPDLASHGYSPEKARAYLDELQSRLRQIPGVESTSLSTIPPLGGRVETTGTEIAGRQIPIHVSRVSPQFFQTMGIPILRGRTLLPGETHSIVVGDSFARLGWPGKDALGGKFTSDNTNYIVVGVVGVARLVERQDPDAVEAYFPLELGSLPSTVVLVKTSGPTEGLLPSIASVARAVRSDTLPYTQLLKTSFNERIGAIQKSAVVVTLLGAVALLIACLGILGLVAYSVSQRTKEIGIRMALGANPADVLAAVLRQFRRTVLAGLLAGVIVAAALSQLLRRELYGISNLDPVSYFAAIGVFSIVATIAALLPARRALSIDPMRALRYD
jgi:predicted permease